MVKFYIYVIGICYIQFIFKRKNNLKKDKNKKGIIPAYLQAFICYYSMCKMRFLISKHPSDNNIIYIYENKVKHYEHYYMKEKKKFSFKNILKWIRTTILFPK